MHSLFPFRHAPRLRAALLAGLVALAASAVSTSAAAFEEKRVLQVSVEVMPTCRFSIGNVYQLSFGRIDATAGQRLVVTKDLDFNCTLGLPFQVKVGNSSTGKWSTSGTWSGAMVGAANENITIPWSLNWTAPNKGAGWSSANLQRIVLTGTLEPEGYREAPLGLYGENVEIVIVY